MSDPECRDVCEKAYEILLKKGDMSKAHVVKLGTAEALIPVVNAALTAANAKAPAHVVDFVARVCLSLVEVHVFEEEAWVNTIRPYLIPFASEEAVAAVTKKVRFV